MQAGDAFSILSESIPMIHKGFSQVLFRNVSLVAASNDQFFLEWEMSGTHTGDFFEIPPTGKKIEVKGLDAISIESGKISEIRSFYDSSLFTQPLMSNE